MTPSEYQQKRKKLGLTQTELARLLGIARETVSRRENGHDELSKEAVLAIQALANKKTCRVSRINEKKLVH